MCSSDLLLDVVTKRVAVDEGVLRDGVGLPQNVDAFEGGLDRKSVV